MPLQSERNQAIQCTRSSTYTRNKAAKALQEDHKQRSHSEAIARCFQRNWQVPRPTIYHTSWPQCTAQTNTLQASTHTSQRNIQTGDRQDVASWCAETSQ